MNNWLVVTGLIASIVVAIVLLRRARRARYLAMESVTKKWLAQAASREDHAL
jgi:hypothetical protein